MHPDEVSPIIELLWKVKFIGFFPRGMKVLLVSFQTALEESRLIEPKLTSNQLKLLLKTDNIFVFNTIEDWIKIK